MSCQHSLISNCSIRIDVIPVGDVSPDAFARYLEVLRQCSTIALRDVTPPGSYSRKRSALQGISWSGSGFVRLNFVPVKRMRSSGGGSEADSGDDGSKDGDASFDTSFVVVEREGGGGGAPGGESADSAALRKIDRMGDGVAGSLSTLQSHHRAFGVIGVCHCPSTSDLAAAFESEFKLAMRGTPSATVCRCFAFEPSDVQMCVDGGIELTIVPGDRELEGEATFARKQGLHIKTVLQTMCTCLIESIDAWLCAPECGPMLAAGKPLPPAAARDGAAAAAQLCTAWDIQWPSSTQKRFGRRVAGRELKWRGDLCLLAGSPLDALGHYSSAVQQCRKDGDGLWAAAAHEGLAAAKLALWSSTHGAGKASFSPRRRIPSPPRSPSSAGVSGGGDGAARRGSGGSSGGRLSGGGGGAKSLRKVAQVDATADATAAATITAAAAPAASSAGGSTGSSVPSSSSSSSSALSSSVAAVPSTSSSRMRAATQEQAVSAAAADWAAIVEHTTIAIAGYSKQEGAFVLGVVANLKLIRLRAMSVQRMGASSVERVARGELRRTIKTHLNGLWHDVLSTAQNRCANFCSRVAVQCALICDGVGLHRCFGLWLREAVRLCVAVGEWDEAHAQLDVLALRRHPWPQVQLGVLRNLLEYATLMKAPALVNRHAAELLERSARGGGRDCIEWQRAVTSCGSDERGRLLSHAELRELGREQEREQLVATSNFSASAQRMISPRGGSALAGEGAAGGARTGVPSTAEREPDRLLIPLSLSSRATVNSPTFTSTPVFGARPRSLTASLSSSPALSARRSVAGLPRPLRLPPSVSTLDDSPGGSATEPTPAASTPRSSSSRLGSVTQRAAEHAAEALLRPLSKSAELLRMSASSRPTGHRRSGGMAMLEGNAGELDKVRMGSADAAAPGSPVSERWNHELDSSARGGMVWALSEAEQKRVAELLKTTAVHAPAPFISSESKRGAADGASVQTPGMPRSTLRVTSLSLQSQTTELDPLAEKASVLHKKYRDTRGGGANKFTGASSGGGEHLSDLRVAGATVMLAERRKTSVNGATAPIKWTALEAAHVDVVLHNPLAIDLTVQSLSLWVDGSGAECYPLTVTVAPFSTLEVALSLKPLVAGPMVIKGCSMFYFGAWRNEHSLRGPCTANVYAPHPRIAVRALGTQAGGVPVPEKLTLLDGEFHPVRISIENVGHSPIAAISISIAVRYRDGLDPATKLLEATRVLWTGISTADTGTLSGGGGDGSVSGNERSNATSLVYPATPQAIARSSSHGSDDASPLISRSRLPRRSKSSGDAALRSSPTTKVRLRRATMRRMLSSDGPSPLSRFASNDSVISNHQSVSSNASWRYLVHRDDGTSRYNSSFAVCWRRFTTAAVSKTMVARRRRSVLQGGASLSARQDTKEAAKAALELKALSLVEWDMLMLELDEAASRMQLPLESGAKMTMPLVLRGVPSCMGATLRVECLSEFKENSIAAATGGKVTTTVPRVRSVAVKMELSSRASIRLVAASVHTVGLPCGQWGVLGGGEGTRCQRMDSDADICIVELRVRNESDEAIAVEGSHSTVCVVSALLHSDLVADDARSYAAPGVAVVDNSEVLRRRVAVGARDAPAVTRRSDVIGCEGLATFEYTYNAVQWERGGSDGPRLLDSPSSRPAARSPRSPCGEQKSTLGTAATPRLRALHGAVKPLKRHGQLPFGAQDTGMLTVAPHSDAVLLLPVPRLCTSLRWKAGGALSAADGVRGSESHDAPFVSAGAENESVALAAAARVMGAFDGGDDTGDDNERAVLGRVPLPFLSERLSVTWRSSGGSVGVLDLNALATAGDMISQQSINKLVPPPVTMHATLLGGGSDDSTTTTPIEVSVGQWVRVRITVEQSVAQGGAARVGGSGVGGGDKGKRRETAAHAKRFASMPMTIGIVPRAHGGEMRGAVRRSETGFDSAATAPRTSASSEEASGSATTTLRARGCRSGERPPSLRASENASAMRLITAEIVSDRKNVPLIGRIYRSVFVGSEAVELLLRNRLAATREEAVQQMVELFAAGAFVHVHNEHMFEDKYLFYRCTTTRGTSSSSTTTTTTTATPVEAKFDDAVIAESSDAVDVTDMEGDADDLEGDEIELLREAEDAVEAVATQRNARRRLSSNDREADDARVDDAAKCPPVTASHRLDASDPAGLFVRSPLFRHSPHVLCSGVFEPSLPSMGPHEGASLFLSLALAPPLLLFV